MKNNFTTKIKLLTTLLLIASCGNLNKIDAQPKLDQHPKRKLEDSSKDNSTDMKLKKDLADLSKKIEDSKDEQKKAQEESKEAKKSGDEEKIKKAAEELEAQQAKTEELSKQAAATLQAAKDALAAKKNESAQIKIELEENEKLINKIGQELYKLRMALAAAFKEEEAKNTKHEALKKEKEALEFLSKENQDLTDAINSYNGAASFVTFSKLPAWLTYREKINSLNSNNIKVKEIKIIFGKLTSYLEKNVLFTSTPVKKSKATSTLLGKSEERIELMDGFEMNKSIKMLAGEALAGLNAALESAQKAFDEGNSKKIKAEADIKAKTDLQAALEAKKAELTAKAIACEEAVKQAEATHALEEIE